MPPPVWICARDPDISPPGQALSLAKPLLSIPMALAMEPSRVGSEEGRRGLVVHWRVCDFTFPL